MTFTNQATYRIGLSQAVPNLGTLSVGYTALVRDTIDQRPQAQHILIVDDNNVYDYVDDEFDLTFGESTFTITNKTGQSWAVGTSISIGLSYAGTGYGSEFLFDFAVKMQRISASTYTVKISDQGKVLVFSGGCVVTLPATLPEGFSCGLVQKGVTGVTVAAASGATVVGEGDPSGTAGQYATATLMILENTDGASAQWLLGGRVA
jgi:hypothetical protein